MAERAHRRKELTGVVVSDRMDKTRVVQVETLRRHPLYEKAVRHVRRYKAHDETNATRVGDVVLIAETRPLSKEKRWRIVRVLERARLEAAETGALALEEPAPAGRAAGRRAAGPGAEEGRRTER